MTGNIRALNGTAIFGKLKDINKSAADLVVLDQELKALIEEIDLGEYDLISPKQPSEDFHKKPARCETCGVSVCFFHPSRKAYRTGINSNDLSPIPISTFTERFGCGTHQFTAGLGLVDTRFPTFTVKDLIEHLKTINPELEVFHRCSCHQDNCYSHTDKSNMSVEGVEGMETGKEFTALVIGELPL
jgi:hypothetical protein